MYGKMLVLTFEDNEDAMMNRILSLIKESWNRATRTKRLKTKTGKHLRVFYRIQIFLLLPIFTGSFIVMETEFVTMFLLTSSDLVSRLTELVKGNSD